MAPAAVLTIVAAYVAVLFAVAWRAGRRADNQGFFTGNRASRWWVVMLAMVGGAMSGVTFVSVPGMVAASGFSYLQMALGFIVGQAVVAFVLVPLFYRSGSGSIYGWLERRFGTEAYRIGAWFFFISKLLAASVKIFLVCLVLQLLAAGHYGIPFAATVAAVVTVVFLYTLRGGVRSLIWTDLLKTSCLVASIVGCVWVVSQQMELSVADLIKTVGESDMSRTLFFDDWRDRRYFFKQLLAGVFVLIAMTGLDQDMMQRNLSCRTPRDAQKNIMLASLMQTFVIAMLLVLGVVLYTWAAEVGIGLPEASDGMFPTVATSAQMPVAVGVMFIVGVVATTLSAAGGAMTALTTTFTLDVLDGGRLDERRLARTRKCVHAGVAVAMCGVVLLLERFNDTNVIDAIYTLASYTYGPILGLFAFGILTRRHVRGRAVGVVAIASPAICYVVQSNAEAWFGGYSLGYELLILNAALVFAGLWAASRRG